MIQHALDKTGVARMMKMIEAGAKVKEISIALSINEEYVEKWMPKKKRSTKKEKKNGDIGSFDM